MRKKVVRKILSFICISVFCSIILVRCSFAYDDGDWQVWQVDSVEGQIAEQWKVKFIEVFKWGDNAKEFYWHSSDLGITYKTCEWFNLGLRYQQIYQKKKTRWIEENRPYMDGIFKWQWADFKFSDVNRFEYRIQEENDDGWRYRNKLMVKFPIKWTKFEIQPYTAEEIFIDFDKGELNGNRIYAGFGMKLIEHLKGDIFYIWENNKKQGDWSSVNIIGAELKFSF